MNPLAAQYETRYAEAEPVPQPAAPSLLDAVLEATGDATPERPARVSAAPVRLDAFLSESDPL